MREVINYKPDVFTARIFAVSTFLLLLVPLLTFCSKSLEKAKQ